MVTYHDNDELTDAHFVADLCGKKLNEAFDETFFAEIDPRVTKYLSIWLNANYHTALECVRSLAISELMENGIEYEE